MTMLGFHIVGKALKRQGVPALINVKTDSNAKAMIAKFSLYDVA